MNSPQFWIVAGPNGAGKTTCVQEKPISEILPKCVFFNPDQRTLEKLQRLGFQGFQDAPIETQKDLFIQSADEVFFEIEQRLKEGHPIGVETVLSSQKYSSLVEMVIAKGGFVGLIYVALASPDIAKMRVANRVKYGGHGVPSDKIEQRWRRSLDNLTGSLRMPRHFGFSITLVLPLKESDRWSRMAIKAPCFS